MIITRNSEALVTVVPVVHRAPKRVFGSMRGRFTVPPEFFQPLPDAEVEAWDQ